MLDKINFEVKQEITNKYDIVAEFDFLLYDRDPFLFFEWCRQWSSFVFKPNQRAVILNIDSDYYNQNVYNTKHPDIGNNNYNFFACCAYFQLPTNFFVYISTQPGIHREIFSVCKLFNLPCPTVIDTLCTKITSPEVIRDTNFDLTQIQKPFICLNGNQRPNRILLLSYLKEHNILDRGYVSYHFDNKSTTLVSTKDCTAENSQQLPILQRGTWPQSRINTTMPMTSTQHEIYNKHCKYFVNQTKKIENDSFSDRYQPNILKNALVYIVTETVFHYPYPWTSEKTIKGILSKRPMIIVGPTHSLKRLHTLGFKTFNSLWDETYDQIEDPAARMAALIDLILSIANLTPDKVKKLAQQSQHIVEFNFNHYCKNFFKRSVFDVYRDTE